MKQGQEAPAGLFRVKGLGIQETTPELGCRGFRLSAWRSGAVGLHGVVAEIKLFKED